MARSKAHRRDFLKMTAAGATALTLSAASAKRVYGANERIGVGFVGVGGRCQAHLDIVNELKKEKVAEPIAVCDVWDGHEGTIDIIQGKTKQTKTYAQGLFPSAKKVGLNVDDTKHVTKDYRKLLDLKEVDVVCIATPDHWHAKISIDAAAAGKDVYCEKPMTKTIDEAHAVVDAMRKHNRVMTVGVQSMADPTWTTASEYIKKGKIGHVAQAQTSYYRNSLMGQWRYYPLWKEMSPKTVNWDMFLGHGFQIFDGTPLGPKIPFDRAIYGQWRCYWPFGGGMFTDLFVHQTTHMIAAMGVRYPTRVVGAGGLYLEYDGRDVPDVATVVADYDEGCQLMITATMINRYPIEEVIRGRLGTIKFVKGGFELIADDPVGKPGIPARLEDRVPGEMVKCEVPDTKTNKNADTKLLWENFLKCVRAKDRNTLSTPELGAAAFTTVSMGVLSYRQGKAFFWDKDARKPITADDSWATRWEQRSKKRGKPNNVVGWAGGETGCDFIPQPYQKLEGPWNDGKDPADSATSSR
jgi:predicted dehydrogenase